MPLLFNGTFEILHLLVFVLCDQRELLGIVASIKMKMKGHKSQMGFSNKLKKERIYGGIYTNDGIGKRLKELRSSMGLTLAQLAAQTGLSISSVSQVERGLVSPTIRTVHALSVALGVSLAWMLDPDSAKTDDPDGPYVVRSTRRRAIYSQGGVTKYMVTPEAAKHCAGFLVTIEPNGSSGDQQTTRAGEELAFILSGSLVLEIEDKVYRLNKGDCLEFPSTLSHRFYNETRAESVALWIQSPK